MLKSKLIIFAAAVFVIAVFAMEFMAIRSGDGLGAKCALTPLGGASNAYAVSCTHDRP